MRIEVGPVDVPNPGTVHRIVVDAYFASALTVSTSFFTFSNNFSQSM